MASKSCNACKANKPVEEFHLNCYGRNGDCKECVKAKNKRYYEANKARIAEQHKARRAAGIQPDVGAVQRRRDTPYEVKYEANLRRIVEARKERYHTDPKFRAYDANRDVFKRLLKSGGADFERFAGCPLWWFREWIECQFTPVMTWGNYATVWEYDHVMPQALTDFRDQEQADACNKWSNIRPELKANNRAKSDIVDEELVASVELDAYTFQLIQEHRALNGNNAQD
jgi:hypothetical protein